MMDVVRLCSELVRIRTENPPGNTEDIVHFIKGYLESLGVKTVIVQNRGGRCNLVTVPAQKPLLCCGHLDVVPAIPEGWAVDPFSGTIQDGCVWGRGSADMKGGCAALLTAFRSLIDRGTEPAADLAFVCDEETGGKYGMQCLIEKKFLFPCDCLIAEPTSPIHPTIGQKGLIRCEAKFRGEPGHASLFPKIGVSAIMEAFALLEYMNELHRREFRVEDDLDRMIEESSHVLEKIFGMHGLHDVLRRIMYNPGTIRGGEKANIVAQHCTLELDIRVPWGCGLPHLLEDIRRHAPRAEITLQTSSEPSFTPPDRRIVRSTCAEIEKLYGERVSPVVQWAATDARHLRKAGFDVVEYGPGEITTLHAINERVSAGALRKAAAIYEGIIGKYTEK
jgi:succinyl-diaminopimelate desuccinylase